MKTKVYITNIEPLGDEGLYQSLYELMPAYRREKIDRLKCVPDKHRSLAVGALLMYALAKSDISLSTPIKVEENGKPYIEGNPVYFNLSHSGNMAMCVISDTRVGCDIELMKKQPNLRVAKRFFSKEEYEAWKTDSKRQNLSNFMLPEKEMHLFSFDEELPNGLKALKFAGHTPGHTVYQIGNLYFIGDLMHAAELQYPHP